MLLTDVTVRNLPTPERGQRTYWDSKLTGFGCRISQGGARSFVLQYGADRQMVTIGRYHPDILPLASAREEAKKILAGHVLGNHRARSVPFDDARDEFLGECRKKNKPKTVYNYERLLAKYFTFGRTRVSDISTADITRKLNKIGAESQREHALVLAKIFFKWAYRKGYVDASPADRFEKPKSASRARVLSDAEVKSLWSACEQPQRLPANFCTIVKLLILTGQRRGEIAALRTSWLTDDRADLPADITKNKLPHAVYLSPLALALCTEAATAATATTRENDTLLFPGVRRGKVFSAWSQAKKDLDKLAGVTGWTLHDLRRTFSTRLNAFTLPHVVEKMLNHASGIISGVAGVYNLFEYAEQRQAAIVEWERRLLTVVNTEEDASLAQGSTGACACSLSEGNMSCNGSSSIRRV